MKIDFIFLLWACFELNFRGQWFEVLDGLLGKHWRNVGLAFNCTFLLFGSVIQLIACARYLPSTVALYYTSINGIIIL